MNNLRATLIGGEEVVHKLGETSGKVRKALHAAIERLSIRLMVSVKRDRLSGQALNVRTGRLRRSITQTVTDDGNRVTGYVGTVVEYAPIHEYGFKGAMNIRAHMRSSKNGKSFSVRAHTKNVTLPERSFMRTALADMKSEIGTKINEALAQAAK